MSRLVEYFREALNRGDLSHAYLLEIEEEDRRLPEAREIAQLILCRTHTACGQCSDCKQVLAGSHPDLVTVTHEKPTVISVDELRTQLVEDVGIRPYKAEHKVYLVPEAELMNPQGQNALLKTLEEPPAYAVILLITGNRSVFLPTVLSRCISLTESGGEQEESIGEAETLLFTYLHRAEHLHTAEAAGIASKMKESGLQKTELYTALKGWFRDLIALQAGTAEEKLLHPGEVSYYRDYGSRLSPAQLEHLWQDIRLAEYRTGANVNADTALEIFFLHLREALRK